MYGNYCVICYEGFRFSPRMVLVNETAHSIICWFALIFLCWCWCQLVNSLTWFPLFILLPVYVQNWVGSMWSSLNRGTIFEYFLVLKSFVCYRCKKYPSMELRGLFQYLVNQLKKGQGIELVLLQVFLLCHFYQRIMFCNICLIKNPNAGF